MKINTSPHLQPDLFFPFSFSVALQGSYPSSEDRSSCFGFLEKERGNLLPPSTLDILNSTLSKT